MHYNVRFRQSLNNKRNVIYEKFIFRVFVLRADVRVVYACTCACVCEIYAVGLPTPTLAAHTIHTFNKRLHYTPQAHTVTATQIQNGIECPCNCSFSLHLKKKN